MIDFSDQPYQFFPPRYIAPLAALIARFNDSWYLPRVKRITAVEVSGHETLRAIRGNDRLLLMPNHPSHVDPYVFLSAARHADLQCQTMAAYDVFLRSRVDAWVMQTLGTFSVDREGSDPQALRHAASVLREGKFALAIFAEGNVYLQNDAVTPFHDGAAMLALRTGRELAEKGGRVRVIPMSIKLTHVDDARRAVMRRLREVAKAVDAPVESDGEPWSMLRSVGLAALQRNLRHRGLDGDLNMDDDLPRLIQSAAEAVLADLERKMRLEPGASDAIAERVRQARRAIHQVRLDETRQADHAAAVVWADQAMLAFRIASYRGDYVAAAPTLDRVAETVEKLAEDVFGHMLPPLAARQAMVHFNEPIDIADRLPAFAQQARAAVRQLTDDAERAVQSGVDHLNRNNSHPGGRLWSELGR